jgi:voltage-gated potassium channel Kch
MPTYTVHEPPPRNGERASAPERFVFVRDGFYVWAFLLTPLWLLWRRLWLAFAIYLVVNFVLGAGVKLIGAPDVVIFLASLLVALLIGLEASSIWRRKLSWKKWKMLGFVVGEDAEAAEQRFFAEWTKRAGATPAVPPAPSQPSYSAPVRRGPPSSTDVIGLFPEPETPR